MALGQPSVAACQRAISSAEFAEWMAYSRVEPFGAEVDHEMLATLTALFAETHRDEKKRRMPFGTEDFMPGVEPPKPLTQAELRRKMDAAMVGLGGKRRDT